MVKPNDNPLVLVCDDDSMQRLLIRQCLESEGMRILEAQDGHEALDLVANNNPDFVFMDVDMHCSSEEKGQWSGIIGTSGGVSCW